MTLTEIKAAYAKGEYESKHVAFLIAGLEAYERDHNFGKCIYENRAIDAEKWLALAEKVVEAARNVSDHSGQCEAEEWKYPHRHCTCSYFTLEDAIAAYDQEKKP